MKEQVAPNVTKGETFSESPGHEEDSQQQLEALWPRGDQT